MPTPVEFPARPRLSGEAYWATVDALAAIDRVRDAVPTFGNWRRDVDPVLAAAAGSAGVLAEVLAATTPPVATESPEATTPIRLYFGVRWATMSAAQVAAAEAAVLARGLADLWAAPIDVNDLIAEIEAARTLLADFVKGSEQPEDRPGRSTSPSPADPSVTGTGLGRWIIGHQVYFVFNIRAAAAVHQALKALNQDRAAAAAGYLVAAAGYVRGFTAAMGHAGAIPGVRYRRQIRPTMAPPDTTVPLTGRMHKEHRGFRTAINQLLGVLPDSYPTLAARQPALAQAREALLEADLLDLERHTMIAASLVGEDRSLVQRREYDNAVATLREMRTARAARYCPLIRFGDRMAAESITAMRERMPARLSVTSPAGR